MEVRRCGGAALAAALALSCAVPQGAARAEQVVRTYAQGEAVPRELVLDGEAYSLSGWEPGGGLEAATRHFERTLRAAVAAGDYGGDAASYFDAELAIDEEGFTGSIPLVAARAEVSASHPERTDYEEAVELEFVGRDEVDSLAGKRAAVVDGREVVLEKLDVQVERQPSDPGTELYSGRVVYGIHEERDVADEYELTASYAGELSRGASAATVVAVYETAGEDADVPDESGLSAWTFAVPAALVAASGAALAFAAVRSRRDREQPGGAAQDSVSGQPLQETADGAPGCTGSETEEEDGAQAGGPEGPAAPEDGRE